jgi:hypothetical protein
MRNVRLFDRMRGREHKTEAEMRDTIRQILLHDWDPIGIGHVCPRDEYDCYITPVYEILVGSQSEEELTNYLFVTARDALGVACETAEHFEQLRPVARKLLDLRAEHGH